MNRRRLLGLLAAALLPAAVARAQGASEERKIEFLIQAIETLQGASFIRNGTAYDAHAAAAHLRMKRQKAGSRVTTVEDFIRYCAATSSSSGVPYRIRFADGHEVTSETFLRSQLANFRGATPRAAYPGSVA